MCVCVSCNRENYLHRVSGDHVIFNKEVHRTPLFDTHAVLCWERILRIWAEKLRQEVGLFEDLKRQLSEKCQFEVERTEDGRAATPTAGW